MAKEFGFTLDAAKFGNLMQKSAEAMYEGAVRGVHDVMDEWSKESVDLAPLYKRKSSKDKRPSGALRGSIDTQVKADGRELAGEISAVAVEVARSGKRAGERFNYAYYLHEAYPKKHGTAFKNPSTSGTVPAFLDQPLEENNDKWLKMIEHEIEIELRQKGW